MASMTLGGANMEARVALIGQSVMGIRVLHFDFRLRPLAHRRFHPVSRIPGLVVASAFSIRTSC
jgi:hypothetical protein